MALAASSEGSGLNPMSFTDQHASVVLERLRYQRNTGRFCDVALIVKDRQFSAHRNVLASCSPYFDSILKSTKVAKEQVTINSKNPAAFELLLNYMYSGSVVIDRSTVSELLRLSNNFLASSEYFDVNINRCLLESVDILQYPISHLTKILQESKYQDVITADTQLKLIVRWVGEEVQSRESLFRQLLNACPIEHVSVDTFDFLLDYSSLFRESQTSRYLMLHKMRELSVLPEKYDAQYVQLAQTLGAEVLMEAAEDEEDDMSSYDEEMADEDMEENDGNAKICEETYEDGVEKPRLKLKINLAGSDPLKKRTKPIDKRRPGPRRRGRPPKVRTEENEMIPMMDDDEIDGVYATASLKGAITYTEEDKLDPDEIEDGEDNAVENGSFNCKFCKFATNSSEELEKHKARLHNRNTLFLCHLCEFETNWNKPFYEHMKEHWIELPYRCDQCDYHTSGPIYEFLAHRLTHNEDRFFKCAECAFRARTRTQLWAHERMHSVLDERPLHCEECGRGFHQHTALIQHSNTHDDNRAHICEECGFASKNPEHMTKHKGQHSGDTFFCYFGGCDYSSPKKSQLAAHLRTHMHVRAHMCKTCGRGFIEKSHLVRHERIHLEDKPFKCDLCEYGSSRRDKLKEHIIKHHNGTIPAKIQRRRYRRARQLAQNVQQQPPQQRPSMSETMFRPIPSGESGLQFGSESRSFQQFVPPRALGASTADQTALLSTHLSLSPPRAMSATTGGSAGSGNSNAVTRTSPGSMSLINVPLGLGALNAASSSSSLAKEPVSETVTGLGAMPTFTLIPRSPHNRTADPFGGLSTPSDPHRPLSLPQFIEPLPPSTTTSNLPSTQNYWQ
ncbi:hypothetical protein WR25_12512 [Diploscapter pachys]|uniref:BTB domain-containing protein n=1 Tax=Diploscapter pachys TaxID=2018661 RepID=A0A2A2JEG5_9BILA|nr:hypothetical protein WR25_12512 [Diploscapter pachys]